MISAFYFPGFIIFCSRWHGLTGDTGPCFSDHNTHSIQHFSLSLLWRHNGHDGVSNHQPHDCLLNRSFGPRSKKTPKLRVTGLCAGNSPVTGEFPAQMASNAENVSIYDVIMVKINADNQWVNRPGMEDTFGQDANSLVVFIHTEYHHEYIEQTEMQGGISAKTMHFMTIRNPLSVIISVLFKTFWPNQNMSCRCRNSCSHYSDVIKGKMASQITSLTIVYSTVYSGSDQRKHQSSASLVFVLGIHRWPKNSPRRGPVTRKMFPFDDVIMGISCIHKVWSRKVATVTKVFTWRLFGFN